MEITMIAAVIFILALAARRRHAFALRWQPTRHTWAAVGAGLLAFVLSALLLLFKDSSVAHRLLHYGGIYVLCGVLIPWGYPLLIEKNTDASIGLTRERWGISLILNGVLGGLFALILIFEADWGAIEPVAFTRATLVLLVGTLFELLLYYGFIHLRLEQAFGTIPAILGTAVLYVLWHAGTQLPHEPDLLIGIVKLFAVGVLYQSVFSLTHNLLAIWPCFLGVGVMIDYAVNIETIDPVSAQLPWAVGALACMLLTGSLIYLRSHTLEALATPSPG